MNRIARIVLSDHDAVFFVHDTPLNRRPWKSLRWRHTRITTLGRCQTWGRRKQGWRKIGDAAFLWWGTFPAEMWLPGKWCSSNRVKASAKVSSQLCIGMKCMRSTDWSLLVWDLEKYCTPQKCRILHTVPNENIPTKCFVARYLPIFIWCYMSLFLIWCMLPIFIWCYTMLTHMF